ncbi:SHS2 domain-containing protein [Curtobacterium sp. 320]|uniref:hypothetical protein n=1 Tax=Curtobacterium sp. 320 TaxID=2817749 RepID=UPI0028623BC0|nr:hypothetical protein [Curtobacterium sp. 320]MDR6574313.1 SHS2 domain-containing protein [Curtobacterium sp. 320]
MNDWSTFPATLLATVVGAAFAGGTSWLLAKQAGGSRHKELMTNRLAALIEAFTEWNAIERPNKRRARMAMDADGPSWMDLWNDQRREAKVKAAAAVLLVELEANKNERPVVDAIRLAIRRLDRLDPNDKADAMTLLNAAVKEWWTGQSTQSSTLAALGAVAQGVELPATESADEHS